MGLDFASCPECNGLPPCFLNSQHRCVTVTRDSLCPNVRENSERRVCSWDEPEIRAVRCPLKSQHCKEIDKTLLGMLPVSPWVD